MNKIELYVEYRVITINPNYTKKNILMKSKILYQLLTIVIRKVIPDRIILVKNRAVYNAGEIHELVPNKGKSSGSIQAKIMILWK